MLGRQITPLLRRLLGVPQFACKGLFNGSSARKIHFSQCSSVVSVHSNVEYGCFTWMFVYGQAALLFGGSCSFVFAEENSYGKPPEISAGEFTNAGLQSVEDGSVISNEHTSKWRIFTDSGRDFFLQGKLKEAETLFSSALEEAKKGFGERDPHVASACNNLAELYRVQKSFDIAEPLYLEAISILEEAFGVDDVRVGVAFHNLGKFYIAQRKLEEARRCYERSLEVKGRVLGLGHADYAETMFHLGTVLYLEGNAKDGEALIQDSIRILEEGGQGESLSCIRKLGYLAKIYMKSNNRFGEAENVKRKILHIMELSKGWESLDTVNAAESLSMTLQSLGKLRDARDLLERCLEVRTKLLSEDDIQIGANFLGLAKLALLNVKEMKTVATSEAIWELDKATELIKNSIRIAQLILDGTKDKSNVKNLRKRNRKDEHIALIILLQSLKTLAHVESTKHEQSGDANPVMEAEQLLRRCIFAFREYGTSTLTSNEAKGDYVSCMKNLLSLISDTTKNVKHSNEVEIEELKCEIRHAEKEISSWRKHDP